VKKIATGVGDGSKSHYLCFPKGAIGNALCMIFFLFSSSSFFGGGVGILGESYYEVIDMRICQ